MDYDEPSQIIYVIVAHYAYDIWKLMSKLFSKMEFGKRMCIWHILMVLYNRNMLKSYLSFIDPFMDWIMHLELGLCVLMRSKILYFKEENVIYTMKSVVGKLHSWSYMLITFYSLETRFLCRVCKDLAQTYRDIHLQRWLYLVKTLKYIKCLIGSMWKTVKEAFYPCLMSCLLTRLGFHLGLIR